MLPSKYVIIYLIICDSIIKIESFFIGSGKEKQCN
nr:MAG TPA: hypothetical protein [Caudoviricetes sp.]